MEIDDILEKWGRIGMGINVMNTQAHYQALVAVKPAIIAFLANLISGMANDETKIIPLMDKKITIRKIQEDAYSGKLEDKDGTIIHVFEMASIPHLAGQLQSHFELYNEAKGKSKNAFIEEMKEKLQGQKQETGDPGHGVVDQLLQIVSGEKPTEESKKEVAEVKDLTEQARAVKDKIIRRKRKDGTLDEKEIASIKAEVERILDKLSLIVPDSSLKTKNDKMHETLHDFQEKHNNLADRSSQELNILHDKIESLRKLIEEKKNAEDKNHKHIEIHLH
jgi:hypothetical protein